MCLQGLQMMKCADLLGLKTQTMAAHPARATTSLFACLFSFLPTNWILPLKNTSYWNVALALRWPLSFSGSPRSIQIKECGRLACIVMRGRKFCVNDEFLKAADFPIYILFSTLSASHFLVKSLALVNPIPLCFLFALRLFNVASVSLASSGLQRSPQGPGGVPALGGDGSDPRGVCRRPGGPHPSAGCRHHHH